MPFPIQNQEVPDLMYNSGVCQLIFTDFYIYDHISIGIYFYLTGYIYNINNYKFTKSLHEEDTFFYYYVILFVFLYI